VDACLPYAKTFKVGKQLFTREGPAIVREIQARGGRVFLDLKFHDIPNTVAAASRSVAELGVFMFNVHAMGGIEMMRAARRAVDGTTAKNKPLIIGVTVLTSLSQPDLELLGIHEIPEVVALRYAEMVKSAGLDGVVCSVHEVEQIKKQCGKDFLTVTPCIRFADNTLKNDDQQRIATPEGAMKAGSDFLVIGRALFASKDSPRSPIDRLKKMIKDCSHA